MSKAIALSFAKALTNGAANPIAEPTPAQFRTTRRGTDRTSMPTKLVSMLFDEVNREIKVLCEDGRMRRCKVDRLPSIEAGRTLWATLAKAGKEGKEMSFTAAGGFSPDTWFYTAS